MKLHYNDKLKVCAESHANAILENDEYKVKELFEADKDIKYIIDIGANMGIASMKFQEFFPEAKILVCEPEPELMMYAKLNTDNKLIYVEEAIIGDDRKEVTFNQCAWAGNGHVDGNFRWDLFEPMGSMKVGEIKVVASTLKEIMDRYEFPRIDVLKIDTEGMEGQILQAFKPYMHLVRHFKGEWHGDKEIPLIKDALQDTHDIFISKQYDTHGDVFAVKKGFPETTIIKDGFKILTRPGMPSKISKL